MQTLSFKMCAFLFLMAASRPETASAIINVGDIVFYRGSLSEDQPVVGTVKTIFANATSHLSAAEVELAPGTNRDLPLSELWVLNPSNRKVGKRLIDTLVNPHCLQGVAEGESTPYTATETEYKCVECGECPCIAPKGEGESHLKR